MCRLIKKQVLVICLCIAEGRRKKEEGRRKKEEAIKSIVSAINNVLTVLAVVINSTIVPWRGLLDRIVCWRNKGLVKAARDGNSI
ncbi:hypothetical protein [Microcoleus sp. herbarium5]|uniref:hypothetical protein n=1 Tax=Microcoleus sp. herbarium5 TaxID=3055434 RepID=UPI002FD76366